MPDEAPRITNVITENNNTFTAWWTVLNSADTQSQPSRCEILPFTFPCLVFGGGALLSQCFPIQISHLLGMFLPALLSLTVGNIFTPVDADISRTPTAHWSPAVINCTHLLDGIAEFPDTQPNVSGGVYKDISRDIVIFKLIGTKCAQESQICCRTEQNERLSWKEFSVLL